MFDLPGQGCHVQLCRLCTAQRHLAKETGESKILLLHLSSHQVILPGVGLHQLKRRSTSVDSQRPYVN